MQNGSILQPHKLVGAGNSLQPMSGDLEEMQHPPSEPFWRNSQCAKPPFSQGHLRLIPILRTHASPEGGLQFSKQPGACLSQPQPLGRALLLLTPRPIEDTFHFRSRHTAPFHLSQHTSLPLHHQTLLGAQTGPVLDHACLALDCCLVPSGRVTHASFSLPPP